MTPDNKPFLKPGDFTPSLSEAAMAPAQPDPELSSKTVDALALAGKHMHAHGIHPHSLPGHVVFEQLMAGYREAGLIPPDPDQRVWHDPIVTRVPPLREIRRRAITSGYPDPADHETK